MRSPWIDLLCLHGYITDPTLLRKLATSPPQAPRPRPRTNRPRIALVKQAAASWRLCLGIGDGLLRSQ
ncbi:hypothetical protein [Dyella acidiphila]|uniref:Uncharacterized protein n=1 Tax=Dyella acidiphila TaxID=2775866 RepID=A0ABR9GCK1_9GAMM|nr:hypothetical protein [Dyella acidiphila]MBE1161764.1 hypothetical protein [Dyella acidiphila]